MLNLHLLLQVLFHHRLTYLTQEEFEGQQDCTLCDVFRIPNLELGKQQFTLFTHCHFSTIFMEAWTETLLNHIIYNLVINVLFQLLGIKYGNWVIQDCSIFEKCVQAFIYIYMHANVQLCVYKFHVCVHTHTQTCNKITWPHRQGTEKPSCFLHITLKLTFIFSLLLSFHFCLICHELRPPTIS